MKKVILSLFLIVSMSINSRAQYAAIPDSNFGNWLNNNGYSACLIGNGTTGWQLDTTCSAVLNARTMNCSFGHIYDLTGVRYFKNLAFLSCYNNILNYLPSLPASLTFLDCNNSEIMTLPILPAGLAQLNCSSNYLNDITNLPSGLTYLDCNSNMLSSIANLPAGLTSLNCSYCTLTSLPSLPASLNYLDCKNNSLVSLPSLPSGLTTLNCSNNALTSLSSLPASLSSFSCQNNPGLSCLPQIYRNDFSQFLTAGTNIFCLPNRFTAQNYDRNPATTPLCTASSVCDFYYNMEGNIHIDTTSSCTADSLHPGTPLHNMKVQLRKNGNVLQQFYTFGSGNYSFKSDSLTSYDVNIDTTGLPVMLSCPAGGVRHVSLTATDSVKINESFGLQCRGVDNGVSSIYGHFGASRMSTVRISAGDIVQMMGYGFSCAAHSAGTVTISIFGSTHYMSPSPGARTPTVSGSNLIYTITDFGSIRAGDFNFVVQTDTNAVIGSSICISTKVHTNGGVDINQINDSLIQCFIVLNSHDPNEKTVSPTANIDTNSQWLTYTVAFQNTGNDTAYTVVVRDTLSQYVDASSFQYLASSHRAVIQLFGSAMVFTFPKIDLVDSLHNEPLSHGWIQYKVKTKAGLPLHTQIQNTAFIYFDLNPAVVTNTVTNTVLTCTNSYDTILRNICTGDSFAFGANYYHTAGYYTRTLSGASAGGCDSIVTLHLQITSPSSHAFSVIICANDSFSFGGAYYHAPGDYTDTLHGASAQGCDSVLTLHLHVIQPSSYSLSVVICANDSVSFGGHYYHVAGTYIDTLHGASASGCDSIVTLHLQVSQPSIYLLSASVCHNDSFSFGGHYYHMAGTYVDTLHGASARGCDSIITLQLAVNPLPAVSWTQTDTLFCEDYMPPAWPLTGFSPPGGTFSGATIMNDTLYPAISIYHITYSYADSNLCSNSVSKTFEFKICLSVSDISGSQLVHVYPNPNTGSFTLETSDMIGQQYVIYDMLGQLIQEKTIITDHQQIDLGQVSTGIYTLIIKGRSEAGKILLR